MEMTGTVKTVNNLGEEEAPTAAYRYVLLTDEQRQQIIHTYRPNRRTAFSCDNLNLVYGIKSEKSGFVMTLVYYLSDCIKRCDEPDDYKFILLFPHSAKIIACQQERSKNNMTLLTHMTKGLQAEVEDALRFYRQDSSNWEFLRCVFGEEKPYSKYVAQNKAYLQELVPEEKRELGADKTAQGHGSNAKTKRMTVTERIRDPLYRKRIVMSIFGIVVCGLSVGMFKAADFGTDPFQVLVAGIDAVTPMPFGTTYMVLCAVLLVAMFLLGRHYIGLGTVLNLFGIGYMAQLSQGIVNRLMPEPTLMARLILLAVAVLILCFASAIYITANLGVSTYDVWALLLAEKTQGPFRLIRIGTDLVCVLAGWLLGGTVGVGTLITAFCMGPLIDYFNRKVAQPMLYGKGADRGIG